MGFPFDLNFNYDQTNQLISDLSTAVTETLNSYLSETSATGSVNLTVNVINGPGGYMDCGSAANFITNTDQNLTAIATIDNSQTQALTTAIAQNFKQATLDSLKQSNPGLSLGDDANVGVNINNLTQYIHDATSNVLKTMISNSVNVSSTASSTIEFTNYGTLVAGECNFVAKAIVRQIATQTASNVVNQLIKNEEITTSDQTSTDKTTQKNKGINLLAMLLPLLIILGLIGLFFFGGFAFIRKYIVPIGAIVLIMCLIGIVWFSIKKEWTDDIVMGVVMVIVIVALAYVYFSTPKTPDVKGTFAMGAGVKK